MSTWSFNARARPSPPQHNHQVPLGGACNTKSTWHPFCWLPTHINRRIYRKLLEIPPALGRCAQNRASPFRAASGLRNTEKRALIPASTDKIVSAFVFQQKVSEYLARPVITKRRRHKSFDVVKSPATCFVLQRSMLPRL